MQIQQNNQQVDLICAGAGIMSATLALMIKLIDPKKNILIFERLDKVSQESSAAWNNSGTGHSGFCELNYTPEQKDGSIDISKAVKIFNQFERSKQFWAYLVGKGFEKDPGSFILPVPHHAWVRGQKQVDFLKKRFDAMKKHKAFESMLYTDDPETMKQWFPLIMQERSYDEPMAATRIEKGTELNFENITKSYFKILEERFDCPVILNTEVKHIHRKKEAKWHVKVKNRITEERTELTSEKVFIGAGGDALLLLEDVNIDEGHGYGGFPVSGEWLICKNHDVIEQHHAKVYTKAGVDAPPMAAPHLDTRHINGKKELMFGPFAGFSTKFLKKGSWLDLAESIEFDNIPSYWGAFWKNLDLTRYLIGQITKNHEDRMHDLQTFVKNARSDEWELKVAGMRVQVIKREPHKGGVLEFGTDVVSSKDGSLSALLGASPGASTAVDIMLGVIEKTFSHEIKNPVWQKKLSEMIPFYDREMDGNEKEFKELEQKVDINLGLMTSTPG